MKLCGSRSQSSQNVWLVPGRVCVCVGAYILYHVLFNRCMCSELYIVFLHLQSNFILLFFWKEKKKASPAPVLGGVVSGMLLQFFPWEKHKATPTPSSKVPATICSRSALKHWTSHCRTAEFIGLPYRAKVRGYLQVWILFLTLQHLESPTQQGWGLPWSSRHIDRGTSSLPWPVYVL